MIITTTNNWSEHAEDALQNQQPPVIKIDLQALANSQIDWAKYQPNETLVFKPKKTLREHQKEAVGAVEFGNDGDCEGIAGAGYSEVRQ